MSSAVSQSVSTGSRASKRTIYLPREHGATAMVITPIVCAAMVAATWQWAEVATLTAAFAALAAKDPLVVLMRQCFVWKQPNAATPVAALWFAVWTVVLALSGVVLLRAWPLSGIVGMAAGMVLLALMAIWVNVKNKQRSTLFQIASSAALTSSSLATCLSATGEIRPWCWWLWVLLAMQATTGILVVHARLDARIALRGKTAASPQYRRAAWIAVVVLGSGAVAMLAKQRMLLGLALALAAAGYGYDLRRQLDAEELQRPLISVGRRALTLATVYALLLVAGLW